MARAHCGGEFGFEGNGRFYWIEFTATEMQVDAGLGRISFGEFVGRKAAGVDDHVIRLAESRQLFLRGADQHVVHEQGVIGAGADDAHLDPMLRGLDFRALKEFPSGDDRLLVEPQARPPAFDVDLRNQQPLAAGETKDMPLRFIVDPNLPGDVSTLTLAYTVFDVTQVAMN